MMVGGYCRPGKETTPDIERVLAAFPRLGERLDQRSGSLSGRAQQMLAIGRALMSQPKLLRVDALSLGLMPKVIDVCYGAIDDLKAKGMAILLVEHSTQRALDVADAVTVLESGRQVWAGTAREARHATGMIDALLELEAAGERLADAMGIASGQPVYHCVMVHKDGHQPVQLSDRFVNPAVAPDYLNQDFTRISPTDYLTRVAPIQEAEHVVSAARPGPLAQKLLNIDAGEPCLQLDRRTWSFGQVATQSRLLYPGSRYRFGGRFRT